MRKFVFFLFFFTMIIESSVLAQNKEIEAIPQLIKQQFVNVPSTYFLFVINPNNGSNTNGNVIIQAFRDIRKRYPQTPIYYIIWNSGISDKNIAKYFDEVLKIQYNAEVKSHTVISGELYFKCYLGNLLSVLEYVYNDSLYYAKPFKISYTPAISFPKNIVSVKLNKKVKVSDKYLNTNLGILKPCGKDILQYSDAGNRLSILNPETGNYIATLDTSEINTMDIFSKYVSNGKEAIDTARKYEKWLKENNRMEFPIYNMYYDGKDIYVYCALQYAKVVDDAFLINVKNMGGGYVGFKKGEIYFASSAFILKCNTQLKINKIYKIVDPPNNLEAMVSPDMAASMYFQGDILHCFNGSYDYMSPETPDSIKKSPYYNKGICRYKISKNELVFDGMDSPPFVTGIDNKSVYIDGTIFPWQNNLYAIYNSSPLIYELNSVNPVSKLHALGIAIPEIKEHYMSNLLDTTKLEYNWEICTNAPIFNNKYMAFLYLYQQRIPILEIKDSSLNTIQIINLSEIIPELTNPDYVKNNIVIMNDTIYIWVFKDGEFYLYNYKISLN